MNQDKAKQVIRAVRNRDVDQLKAVFRWLLNHYHLPDVLIWALSTVNAKLLEADVEWLLNQIETSSYLPTELKEKVDIALFKHLVKIGCEPGKDFVLTGNVFTTSSRADKLITSTIASHL